MIEYYEPSFEGELSLSEDSESINLEDSSAHDDDDDDEDDK